MAKKQPLPHCPDCGSYAWRDVGSTGRFVLCRLCGARWAIDTLRVVAAFR